MQNEPNSALAIYKSIPDLTKWRKEVATRQQIAVIVMHTELVKQLTPPLSQQQRDVLIGALECQQFTVDELVRRANSVGIKKTYNTIAFEYWIEDLVCLRTELEKEATIRAQQIIERRKKECEEINKNLPNLTEHLAQEGLMDSIAYSRYQTERTAEQVRVKNEKRIREARRFILKADKETKDKLYQKLLAKTKEQYDKHYREWLHISAPELLDEVEELIDTTLQPIKI